MRCESMRVVWRVRAGDGTEAPLSRRLAPSRLSRFAAWRGRPRTRTRTPRIGPCGRDIHHADRLERGPHKKQKKKKKMARNTAASATRRLCHRTLSMWAPRAPRRRRLAATTTRGRAHFPSLIRRNDPRCGRSPCRCWSHCHEARAVPSFLPGVENPKDVDHDGRIVRGFNFPSQDTAP